MQKRLKIFTVKFRGGETVEVIAKNRAEAVKAAKAECEERAISCDVLPTDNRIAMYREELYYLTQAPDDPCANCLSIGAANYLATLLEQTGGEESHV